MSDFEIEWTELGVTRQFISAIKDMGFAAPTEIQSRAIPLVNGGQNLIGIAQTGTGKTAAYLLPILGKLKFNRPESPRALVLLPTKELVKQVADVCRQASIYSDIRVAELYGGVGPKSQIETLKSGVDVIISTPGRFEELYFTGNIPTKQLKILVVDEADRLMDMHFRPQLRKILEWLPSKRQNMLFSATFSTRIEQLAEDFMEFPVKVEVTPQATPAALVQQVAYRVPNFKTKLNLLELLLKDATMNRIIIFARTKETVTNLSKYLERIEAGQIRSIHSNKGQNARHNAIAAFSEGEIRLLISTDVTARGIDVKQVSHVINFDVPVIYDDYVHRIGRTGRANSTGIAISFITPADEYHITKIEKLIREKIERKTLPKEVQIESTPYHESQAMAREIDRQKRQDDPTYQGAFHERKK